VISGITLAIDTAGKKVTDFLNWASDQAKEHPALNFLIPGIGSLPHLDPVMQSGYEPMSFTNEMVRASQNLANETVRLYRQSQHLQTEANNAMSQITAKRPGVSLMNQPDDYDAYIHGKLPFATKPAPAGTPISTDKAKKGSMSTAGLTGFVSDRQFARYQQALRALPADLRAKIIEYATNYDIPSALALAQIFSESTFNTKAVSPFNANVGSSAFGLTQVLPATATALLHHKTSGKDLFNTDTALTAWGKYMNKLFDEFGDWELAAFAYHNGEGAARKFARVLESGNQKRIAGYAKGSPKGIAYAKQISALAGLSKDDQFGVEDPSKMSDRLTKESRDAMTRTIIKIWMQMGIIPDGKTLGDIQKLMAEDARKVGGVQPDQGDVVAMFRRAALGRAGTPITDSPAPISSAINPRPTLDEDYVKNFREQLGIEQATADLVFKRANAEALISAELEGQVQFRKVAVEDLDREYQLTLRMNVAAESDVRARQERNGLAREYRDIEIELANLYKNDPLRRQLDQMRDILSVERSRLDLSHAMEVSNDKIRAGVYEHMAAQKTLNQGIVDGINGTYDAILSRMNEPLDKLNQKSKGLLSFITEPLKAMNAQGLNRVLSPIMDKIFPGFEKAKDPVVGELKDHTRLLEQIARNTGGMPAGYNPTTGGISGAFGSIFNSGGNGPGGTPWFNPGGHGPSYNPDDMGSFGSTGGGAPQNPEDFLMAKGQEWGQQQKGGLGAIFGPMFAAKKNILTGQMSGLAGKMGGIGSIASMLGGMVPGRAGRMLQYGGMGAQIGANFGPWGAAIGAAAGAIFGLFGHRDDAIKKLKEAALSTYGVDIKSKSVLEQLNAIGEGSFGKGNVGKNASAIVSSEDAQQIIRDYALSTGQSTTRLDKANYGDAEWSGNQFTQRFGGMSSLSGGSRSAVFTPTRNSSVFPTTSQVSTTSGGGGMDTMLMASHAEAMHRVADAIEKLEAVPADHVVMKGLAANPDLAADAYDRAVANDPYRSETQGRNRGEFQ
jgi:soluble lytic murein transglycosylase-like protein